jgi:hypothetical protein
MDNDKVRPEWARCINELDVQGLIAIVTRPDFLFQQFSPPGFCKKLYYVNKNIRSVTPLGYSMLLRDFWAFEILLEAGANPDADYVIYNDDTWKNATYTPLEYLEIAFLAEGFMECLLDHGASTRFIIRRTQSPFIDYVSKFNTRRVDLILAAHDRELRAYTAVWCANHAGGSWPDMAVLLQAMVMRDELTCEVSSSPSKRRKK